MSGGDSTVLLSKIAVANNMVTEAQVDAALRQKKKLKSRLPIGEMLLQLGMISGDQYKSLMEMQRTAMRDRGDEEVEETRLFGKLVLERGMATPEQVKECLEAQSRRAVEGEYLNLGEILVEKKYLTEVQVRHILSEGDKVIMICTGCTQKYNVLRKWLGTAKCPQCHSELMPADDDRGLGVLATLEGIFPSDSPVGWDFGGCKIIELIGRGSMGTVYKAKHVGLNRLVAVKMISMTGRDSEIVKRLLFEARAIARLEHPNIVQVYDVGFQRGFFFMVMQLLTGETLSERIREMGQLFIEDAVDIIADVARGLSAAHERGIIHRDVKPDNVILTEDKHARITDFGLAQDMTEPSNEEGTIAGTPYYMAPEMWLGHRADERSDLYSVGVMFYQMVTGKKPFDSEMLQEIMNQHLKRVPKPPHVLNRDVPKPLSAIIRKSIAKAPKRRYDNMNTFMKDLGRFQRGEDPEALKQFGQVVRCGFCETLNPVTDTKCKVCHEPLHRAEQELGFAPREDEFKCPKCAEFVEKGMRECPKCMVPFCRRCRRRLPVLQGFCQYCMEHSPRRKR